MLLVPVGDFPRDLLYQISYRARIPIGSGKLDPAFALNPARNQYDSTRLVAELKARFPEGMVIGAAACGLFIPVLTFVFGEAQMSGPCAVLSTHRLRQEFYGLPPDRELFRQRLIKEAVHELGHTLNLTHCDDYRCVMASSHAVEWIDLKESSLCGNCKAGAAPEVQVESARNYWSR